MKQAEQTPHEAGTVAGQEAGEIGKGLGIVLDGDALQELALIQAYPYVRSEGFNTREYVESFQQTYRNTNPGT